MKVVFLDRDGVINQFPGNGKYVTKVKDFHFLPGALEALGLLTKTGCAVFVVSNQAGVSRGVYSRKKLKQINDHMLKFVRKTGGKISRVFYCIHRPHEDCDCRKPKTGSLKKAFALLKGRSKKSSKSFFVGDTESDIETGKRAGCKTIFVLSGKDGRKDLKKWSVKPDYIVENLLKATEIITNESPNHSCLRRVRTH